MTPDASQTVWADISPGQKFEPSARQKELFPDVENWITIREAARDVMIESINIIDRNDYIITVNNKRKEMWWVAPIGYEETFETLQKFPLGYNSCCFRIRKIKESA